MSLYIRGGQHRATSFTFSFFQRGNSFCSAGTIGFRREEIRVPLRDSFGLEGNYRSSEPGDAFICAASIHRSPKAIVPYLFTRSLIETTLTWHGTVIISFFYPGNCPKGRI
jgi:hypothetical protein